MRFGAEFGCLVYTQNSAFCQVKRESSGIYSGYVGFLTELVQTP
jgi:hypothetical protein